MKKNIFAKFNIKMLVVVETALLLLGVMCLFIPREEIVLSTDIFANNPLYNSDSDGFTISENTLPFESEVHSKEFVIPKGIYEVTFLYSSDSDRTNYLTYCTNNTSYRALRTNMVMLYDNQDSITYNIAVKRDIPIYIKLDWGGKGTMTVKGVCFRKTNIPARICVFWMVIIFLLVDGIYLKSKQNFFTTDRKITLLCLIVCFVFNCIPMMQNKIVSGGDLGYHILRIQMLAESLSERQFPVRIFSDWMFGYGYSDAVMYGHTMLYVPALLRLIGFSTTFSYQMFLAVVNILTIGCSYYCFKKAFKEKRIAVVLTFLYTLMPYRLFTLYTAANCGIYCAATFIPLVFLGVYRIFTCEVTEKDYKTNWIYIALGLSGIVTNHVLSTEITCGIILLICIIMIRKIFKREVFLELLKSVLGFVACSLWFLLPFVENYLKFDYHIKNVSARRIQNRGILPTQFFSLFVKLGDHDFYGNQGLQGATIMTVGLTLAIAIIGFAYIYIAFEDIRKKQIAKTGCVIWILCLITSFMCTLMFPWDWIQDRGQLFASLVSSIQFPTRIIIYAGFFATALCGINYILLKTRNERIAKYYVGISIILCIITCCNFSTENSYTYGTLDLYDTKEMGTGYTSGGEYLPQKLYGIDNEVLKYRGAESSNNVSVLEFSKDKAKTLIKLENNTDYEGYVDVPYINYLGYSIIDIKTKEKIEKQEGNRCDIRAIIPPNYSGTIKVEYKGQWYWHVSDLFSLAFLISLIGFFTVKKKKLAEEYLEEKN